MKLSVVDERNAPIREPFVLRLSCWSLDRYLREAPEDARWEFVRCEAKGCGKVLTGPAVRLAPDVVREPDVFVVRPEEIHRATGVPWTLYLSS